MKTLIIIAGLPGTGKSYLARILVKKLSRTLYFDSDKFAKNYLQGRDVGDPEVRLGCHAAKLERILSEFRSYDNVLLDTCFDMVASREMIYDFVKKNGLRLKVIEVVCSLETAKERILKGGDEERMPGTVKSRWEGYQKMRKNWVDIKDVFLRVDSEKDVEKQLVGFVRELPRQII